MGKRNTKKYFLLFGIFLITIGVGFFLFYKETENNVEHENVVLTVNGVSVISTDIEHYLREVSRDYFESKLTPEELRIEAIKAAVAIIVIEEYFNKKNIYISENEVEREIMNYVNRQPGAETKEDYFNIMEMRGYSRQEVLRNIELSLKNQKLEDILAQDIVIDEKDIIERYEWYLEYYENEEVEVLPFEDAKESIRKEIAIERAVDIIQGELNLEGENSEIVFFE